MFANRISPDIVIDQLGAESYDPSILEVVVRFKDGPRLGEFLTGRPRLGVTGTIADAYVTADTPQAVPYITTKQVSGLFAYAERCKYITAEADRKWSKCRIRDGAVLINKSGNVGASALLRLNGHEYASSVSDIININVRDGFDGLDAAFLVVFLNSRFGQKQLQRLSGGAVFSHVSIYAIPEVRLLKPPLQSQTYIGDKVRQAEKCRCAANTLRSRNSALFAELFPPIPETPRHKRVSGSLLSGRLDHLHYRGDLLENYRRLVATQHVALGDSEYFNGLTDGDHGNPEYGEGPVYIRASELDGHLLDTRRCVRVSEAYAARVPRSCLAQPGDVIFSIVGTLGLAGVVASNVEQVLSRGIAKVTPLKLPAFYVKAFMRTPAFS